MEETRHEPLISIITIVYNGESYIEKTLQSVVHQSYKKIEYIVIDGGSTDNTIKIINKYTANITRFISEKDNGIYDAMNKGLSVATGEWVNFLNGGDYYYNENTLEQIFKPLSGNFNFIYGDSITISDSFQKYIKPPQLSRNSLKKSMGLCHQAVFVKKSFASNYDLAYKYKAEYNWVIDIIWSIPASTIHYHSKPVVYYTLGGFSEKGMLANLIEFISITKKRFGVVQVLKNFPTYIKIFLRFYKYKFFGYGW